jgi:hypothetical protein
MSVNQSGDSDPEWLGSGRSLRVGRLNCHKEKPGEEDCEELFHGEPLEYRRNGSRFGRRAGLWLCERHSERILDGLQLL